jgi:hypothetical protein
MKNPPCPPFPKGDLGGFEVFHGKACGYNELLFEGDAVSGNIKNQQNATAWANCTGQEQPPQPGKGLPRRMPQ